MDKKVQWALVGAAWFLALGVVGIAWYALVRQPLFKTAFETKGQSLELPATARCPVTDEKLRVSSDTPQAVYQGKRYFFSEGKNSDGFSPRDQFLMDPSRWAGDKTSSDFE